MTTLRFIAHIVFGISLGICLANISKEWSVFDQCLFTGFAGGLFSIAAEFFQAYNYTRIVGGISKDTMELDDIIKNFTGVIVGHVVVTVTGAHYLFGIVPLAAIGLYAIVQVIRRKHI